MSTSTIIDPKSISDDYSYQIKGLFGIAVAGLIIKFFFPQKISISGDTGPANSTIWGYGFIILSTLGLLIISIALGTKSNMQESIMDFTKKFLSSSMPIILLLGILIWIVSLNISYSKRINQGKVASVFNKFSTMTSILLTIQMLILVDYLNKKNSNGSVKKEEALLKASQMASVSYLFGILSMTFVSMIQIILKYFSTDG
jgi:hypothetical protein